MGTSISKRLFLVWLLLSAITLLYLWIDHSVDLDGAFGPSAVVTTSAIVIAMIKVRIIFREFMETRHAPIGLRLITDGWVVLVGALLLGAYFIGIATSH